MLLLLCATKSLKIYIDEIVGSFLRYSPQQSVTTMQCVSSVEANKFEYGKSFHSSGAAANNFCTGVVDIRLQDGNTGIR